MLILVLSIYQIFVDMFHVLPSVLFDLPFTSSWDLEKKYPEIVSYTLFEAPMVITQTLLLFILNNCSPSRSPILRIPFWLSPLGFPAHFLQYSNPNNSLNLSLYLNPKAFYLNQHIIYIYLPPLTWLNLQCETPSLIISTFCLLCPSN